jgi:uncharacterized protein (TIGR02996 family)
MFEAVAEAWRRDSEAAARAAKTAGLHVTARQLDGLRRAVARTNGTRKVRLLEPAQIFDAIASALGDPHGVGIVHGGEANVGEQRTSLCLAYRDGKRITVGVGLSAARSPGPGVTWKELQPWSRVAPEKNVERLRAWAKKPKADRASFAIEPRPNGRKTTGSAASLLRAVLADPDDDAARSVYADQLLDRGDPRGELITVQLALAKATPGSKQHAQLTRASEALLAAHGTKWSREVAQLTTKQFYRRGFIERVEMHARNFASDGAKLLALAPITALRLRGLDRALKKFASAPALARIRELELVEAFSMDDLMLLANGGQLGGLRGLRLDAHDRVLAPRVLERLLAAAPALEWIAIDLDDELAEVLLRYPKVAVLTHTRSRSRAVRALRAAKRLRPRD